MVIHDESQVKEFIKMLDELTSTHLEIGIFSDSGGDVLMIANVQEFGCNIKVTDKMRGYLHSIGIHLKKETTEIKIPERSFVRKSYDENKNKIIDNADKLLEKVVNLELPVSVFFDTLGQYIVGLVQEYMTDLKSPPNHPATVANKGSSNPLISTGRLRQSITFRQVRN